MQIIVFKMNLEIIFILLIMSIISLHSKRFNDIIVYKLLKVQHYVYSPISLTRFYRKRKYSYFTQDSSRIVVGYVIDTIDGPIQHPIIDRSNIRKKRNLFFKIKNKIKQNYINKVYSILYQQTKLPESIISSITSFL